MSINSRIRQILELKAGGNQAEFSKIFDASPQYVSKLIKEGGSVGLDPVIKILAAYPDINARWLIMGDRQMLDPSEVNDVRLNIHNNIKKLLEIEQYIPFMSTEELNKYKDATQTLSSIDYDEQTIGSWRDRFDASRSK